MSREKTNPPEYGMELKLAAVRRVLAGESVSAVAQELKQEQVHGRDWRDLDALRAELTTFFEITYNHQRLHSALNYQTPAAFEQQLGSVANGKASTEMTGARELTAPSPQTPLPGLQSFSQENCP
jgi:transposase-like protein